MSDNKNIEAAEVAETTETAEATEIVENTATKYTIDYVLEQIENLQKQITENSLHRLQGAVSSIYGNESEADDDAVESRNSSVYSVCEVFKDREDTLCRLLAFYEKMYDDLKPKECERLAALNRLSDLIAGSGNFSGDTDDLRHILNMF